MRSAIPRKPMSRAEATEPQILQREPGRSIDVDGRVRADEDGADGLVDQRRRAGE